MGNIPLKHLVLYTGCRKTSKVHQPAAAMSTLSPSAPSPKVKRRPSTRKRAPSHLPQVQTQETHDTALHAIRNVLKGRTSYDAFPVSFRLIVLDTKLNVKKALQCLLLNGMLPSSLIFIFPHSHHRRSFCSAMEQRKIKVCWDAHRPRYNTSHPILLRYSKL